MMVITNSIAVIEEEYWIETYGKEYREYLNMTPRWIGLPRC
jgi:protein-S-isoprenylcysteine O-methyltransferase Ste14